MEGELGGHGSLCFAFLLPNIANSLFSPGRGGGLPCLRGLALWDGEESPGLSSSFDEGHLPRMGDKRFDPGPCSQPHGGSRCEPGLREVCSAELEEAPLTVKSDMSAIVRVMQLPDSGLEIRDRMWLKITIANAVIGESLAVWEGPRLFLILA